MGVFDDIRKNQVPKPVSEISVKKPPVVGFVWQSILIKYDYSKGTSEVVVSFSKPAQESAIKQLYKKKKNKTPNVEIKKPQEAKKLF